MKRQYTHANTLPVDARREPAGGSGRAALCGALAVRPFDYDERGENLGRALMLAEACATYESDEQNAALALLVGGLAAVAESDHRQAVAYLVIERIFSRTSAAQRAAQRFLDEWDRVEKLLGSV